MIDSQLFILYMHCTNWLKMNSKMIFNNIFIYLVDLFVLILSRRQLMIFTIILLILSFLEISLLLLFLCFDGLVLVLLLIYLLVGLILVVFVFLSVDLLLCFSKIALFFCYVKVFLIHFRFLLYFHSEFLFLLGVLFLQEQ
jgi:hypothetical protein